LLREGLIYLSESALMRRFATNAPGARTMARRFVAGETVEDGVRAARELNAAGLTVSLDYLGESVHNREEARAAADTYLRMIDRIVEEKLDANVSLKLTQMGQDIDDAFLRENVGRVLDRARTADMFVRLDMESSDYTQRTIEFFRSIWDVGYRNVGIVLQSYMRRSADDVQLANALGARVRLCKGAYQEPEAVALQEKSAVDANFVALMQRLLSDGTYPGIATHDHAMIRATQDYAATHNVDRSDFEFQMLYGVRRDLQHQLHRAGYNLRIYVPFGEAWYPYLMRRMAERPANLFFIVNAVLAETPLRVFMKNSGMNNG
jgi:proline dehydrogenase